MVKPASQGIKRKDHIDDASTRLFMENQRLPFLSMQQKSPHSLKSWMQWTINWFLPTIQEI